MNHGQNNPGNAGDNYFNSNLRGFIILCSYVVLLLICAARGVWAKSISLLLPLAADNIVLSYRALGRKLFLLAVLQ